MDAPRMPVFRGARPLKRWRYVGAFSPALIVCAAEVQVGPLTRRFFAAAEPDGSIVSGAKPLGARAVELTDGNVRIRSRAADVDLALEEGPGVATTHDGERIWTRKQAGIPARVDARVADRRYALDCLAVVDDTAGYHPRRTRWRWCAGVGVNEAGLTVAWNLVSGVNDEPTGSERAIWVAGAAHEPQPVTFADDLSGVAFGEGEALRFSEWCRHGMSLRTGLLRIAYEQPFGSFSGALPGAGALREGYGVMELHDARW